MEGVAKQFSATTSNNRNLNPRLINLVNKQEDFQTQRALKLSPEWKNGDPKACRSAGADLQPIQYHPLGLQRDPYLGQDPAFEPRMSFLIFRISTRALIGSMNRFLENFPNEIVDDRA